MAMITISFPSLAAVWRLRMATEIGRMSIAAHYGFSPSRQRAYEYFVERAVERRMQHRGCRTLASPLRWPRFGSPSLADVSIRQRTITPREEPAKSRHRRRNMRRHYFDTRRCQRFYAAMIWAGHAIFTRSRLQLDDDILHAASRACCARTAFRQLACDYCRSATGHAA